MSANINCLLIDPDQRSQLIFSLAHHRSGSLQVLVAEHVQKQFYQDALLNTNYHNLFFSTFDQYLVSGTANGESVAIIDIPHTFELIKSIIQKANSFNQKFYLLLLKINKKYLKMLQKKILITANILDFSPNKFIGINDKLRQLVDQSYDMNRAAFYAYGSFINYFRGNLLKKIFRTDLIDVAKLSRSFGFTTPPRVKQGKFLSVKAQKNKQKVLKIQKSQRKQISQKKISQASVQKTQIPVQTKVAKPSKKKIIKKISK